MSELAICKRGRKVQLTTTTYRTEGPIDHFVGAHEQLVWNSHAGFGRYLAGDDAGWTPCSALNTNQPKSSISSSTITDPHGREGIADSMSGVD